MKGHNCFATVFAALEIILKSVYTGELEIQETLLTDLIDLASYLQYEEVFHCPGRASFIQAQIEDRECQINMPSLSSPKFIPDSPVGFLVAPCC